jgi:capsular exopolysaccharide synthesis family protein
MPMTYDLNLREYWRTIRKRKGIVIFTIVMMTLFSFIFSILGRPVPIYKTSASVKIEKSDTVTGLYLQSISTSSTDYMETQMAMIKSYLIMELAAKKMGSVPPEVSSDEVRNTPKYLSAILALKDKVETQQEGNSGIINITVGSDDPQYAQRLANTVAQVYKERHALDLNRRVIEAKKFIESQVIITKDKLQRSEEAIRDFRETNRMVSLDSQSSGFVSQFSGMQATNDRDLDIMSKINNIAKLLARAEDSPLSSKTIFYFEEASAPYKSLNDRLVQLMLERDILLINYTENFPQVVEIKKQIHEIITSMSSQLQAQQKNLAQAISLSKKQLKNLDDQLKSLPAKGLELARLEREVNVNREIYTMLEKRYQESLIQNAEQLEEVQIVKPALEPSDPINPPKTGATTGLGLIIGIILSVVFAFVVETFDTSIGAVEDVEEFLGARVLGVIPHVNFDELKMTLKEKLGKDVDSDQLWRIGRLISHFAPKTTSAESYRALRTNINFVKLEKDAKTIVFTSSSPQEGKTTVSINLAITMAQAGHKVLLIDGDFRRPVISKIFGIPSLPGLTDVILGNYKWRDVVRSITDLMTGKMTMDELMVTPGLDNLYIMTCGTIAPNPSELVSTRINTDVINESHEEYDFVIIDAPPVLAATDAAVWGTKADGIVIVYQVGKIARGALKRAKAQLDNVKARIIGVVLNGLKAEISPDYEYHDKYYYYYGSERKKTLTLGERILSWQELGKKYVKNFPGKLNKFKKEKETQKENVNIRSGIRSGVLRIGLLLLALGLLIAGLYYSMVMNRPVRVPAKPGNVIMKPPPPKVQTAPVPAVPSKTAVDPSAAASFPPQSAFVTSEKKAPGEHENSPPVTPNEPNEPYTIQVRATQYLGMAKDTVAALKLQGHDAYREMVDLKEKGVWYRIYIGQFASENEARQYIQRKNIAAVYPGWMIYKADKMVVKAPAPTDRPYGIKVSYTQDFRTAEDAVDALKVEGHEAYSTKVDLQKKGIWYRIFIGPFASENEARQYIQRKNIAAVYPDWMIYKATDFVARAPRNKDKS